MTGVIVQPFIGLLTAMFIYRLDYYWYWTFEIRGVVVCRPDVMIFGSLLGFKQFLTGSPMGYRARCHGIPPGKPRDPAAFHVWEPAAPHNLPGD